MSQQKDINLLRNIAQRLKELRSDKGVSQQDVYNDTEIHIARVEAAKTNITVTTLSKLCDYFGISLSHFFKEGFEKSNEDNTMK